MNIGIHQEFTIVFAVCSPKRSQKVRHHGEQIDMEATLSGALAAAGELAEGPSSEMCCKQTYDIHIYIYICMYVCMCMYVYIYMYIYVIYMFLSVYSEIYFALSYLIFCIYIYILIIYM